MSSKATVELKLLGTPQYQSADEPNSEAVAIPSEHPLLLLTYLNAHEAWISRKEIFALLFEEDEESVARNKLRQLLFRAKKQTWFEGFEAQPQQLKHEANTDLRTFRTAVEKGDWLTAVDSYGGKLLTDVAVSHLPSYETWLDNEREDIEGSFEEAAVWCAKTLEEQAESARACKVLLKLLKKDPLNEDAMQAYLRNAVQLESSNELENATKRYENFKVQLVRDLSMEPLAETIDYANVLIDTLNQKNLEALKNKSEVQATVVKEASLGLGNVPKGLPPFVGRDPELAHLVTLLEDDDTQLLTLIGLGGIGKTRLSIAVANDYIANDYSASQEVVGVFVGLANTSSAEFVPSVVLAALGLEPTPKSTPTAQIISYLTAKPYLLVFDNFEHLMDGTKFVQEIANELPNLKILITSRERLNLSNEQVFELTGMALPKEIDETTELEAFDAIKLFLKSARRNNPKFTFNDENKSTIFELCQILQGVPLAIELAASWLRMMTVDEILSEAQESFDLLESDFDDLPERHQSLRAVFDSSWNLLTKEEQDGLVPLAVFTGGFTLEAAKKVIGAKPRTLLRLVNKSMLRRDQNGRFEFLTVMRQYTEEKLLANSKLSDELKLNHADYYKNLVAESVPYLKGSQEQTQWLDDLGEDHSNLRQALDYYLEANRLNFAFELANNLFHYWFIRGHWNEAQSYYERLLTKSSTPELNEDIAFATAHTGYIATVQGHYSTATALLEKSLNSFEDSNTQEGIAYALLCIGLNANYQAQYDQAETYYQKSLVVYEDLEDEQGTANVLHELGVVNIRKGDFESAKEYLQEALNLRQSFEDARGTARTLTNLGIIARRKGDYETTEELYKESLGLSRKINDQLGVANTLISFGVLVKVQSRYPEAQTAYSESLEIFRKTGDKLGEAIILENFSMLYNLQKDYATAKTYAEACLDNHRTRQDTWGIARAQNVLGKINYFQGLLQESITSFLEGQKIAKELNDRQLILQSLEVFSVALSKTDYTQLCLLSLAQAIHLADELQVVALPQEAKLMSETKESLETVLGKKAFTKSWKEGQAIDLENLLDQLAEIDVLEIALELT